MKEIEKLIKSFQKKLKIHKQNGILFGDDLEKIQEDKRLREFRIEEETRLKKLQVSQTNVLNELDKDGNGEVDVVEVVPDGEGVSWVSGPGLGRKRIRLNRKLLHTSWVFLGAQSRPRVWKRLHHLGHSVGVLADVKRRPLDQLDEGFVPVLNRTGVV